LNKFRTQEAVTSRGLTFALPLHKSNRIPIE
jgi:hypothetical protein